jgi:hypothetical protein
MMGSWSQVWQAFAAAMLAQPPLIAIVIASGSVLVLVLAVEGLLVSIFPHHVARRMRVLPPLPVAEEKAAPRPARDLGLEPGFATSVTDLRMVVRDMRDSAPKN